RCRYVANASECMSWFLSSQPALAPLVVLGVPIAAAPTCLGQPEIKRLHVGVRGELGGSPLEHDSARLQHVATVCDAECPGGVLLDQEHAQAELRVEPPDDAEHLFHQARR